MVTRRDFSSMTNRPPTNRYRTGKGGSQENKFEPVWGWDPRWKNLTRTKGIGLHVYVCVCVCVLGRGCLDHMGTPSLRLTHCSGRTQVLYNMCFIVLYFHSHAFFSLEIAKMCFFVLYFLKNVLYFCELFKWVKFLFQVFIYNTKIDEL